MKKVLYLILGYALSLPIHAQSYVTSSPDSVCAGATNVVYRIPPSSSNPASTYNWSVNGGGSIIPQANDDSIYVNWSGTIGQSKVFVSETSSGGCTSPDAEILVERYRPSAAMSGGPFTICQGVGGTVPVLLNFTGQPPFNIAYKITNGLLNVQFTENNIQEKSKTVNISIPSYLPAGTYTGSLVSATDRIGCSALSLSGTVTLIISQTAKPVATVNTQPSCTVSTGSIQVSSPVGTGFTYSTGGSFQTSTSFSNLSPGIYSVIAKNKDGCSSAPLTGLVVNPQPTTPSAPIGSVISQPGCSDSTGIIQIDQPIGSNLTFSIGGAYQTSNIFNGLNPGNYLVSVKNSDGCTNTAISNLTILPKLIIPGSLVAAVSAQTDCNNPTGAITITKPTGAGFVFSVGGVFQSSAIFSNLPPGAYNISVKSSDGCLASYTQTFIINPQPQKPATPSATINQPDCNASSGSISIITPTGTGIQYSIGGSYQTSNLFENLLPGTYKVSAKNESGCISDESNALVVNPQPPIPVKPVIQHIR